MSGDCFRQFLAIVQHLDDRALRDEYISRNALAGAAYASCDGRPQSYFRMVTDQARPITSHA